MKFLPQPNHMKRQSCQAFTRRDLVVVIVVVLGAITVLFLAALNAARNFARGINCASQLKQMGLVFRSWEGDNGDHYPMQAYTNKLGAPLYMNSTNAFRYFQVMSNDFNDPKILVCPTDKKQPATNFTSDFNSEHVS